MSEKDPMPEEWRASIAAAIGCDAAEIKTVKELPERSIPSKMPVKGDVDPTDKVRQHLRELEQMIVALPANTNDQSIAARRIRSMVGDQLAELTWWRPKGP